MRVDFAALLRAPGAPARPTPPQALRPGTFGELLATLTGAAPGAPARMAALATPGALHAPPRPADPALADASVSPQLEATPPEAARFGAELGVSREGPPRVAEAPAEGGDPRLASLLPAVPAPTPTPSVESPPLQRPAGRDRIDPGTPAPVPPRPAPVDLRPMPVEEPAVALRPAVSDDATRVLDTRIQPSALPELGAPAQTADRVRPDSPYAPLPADRPQTRPDASRGNAHSPVHIPAVQAEAPAAAPSAHSAPSAPSAPSALQQRFAASAETDGAAPLKMDATLPGRPTAPVAPDAKDARPHADPSPASRDAAAASLRIPADPGPTGRPEPAERLRTLTRREPATQPGPDPRDQAVWQPRPERPVLAPRPVVDPAPLELRDATTPRPTPLPASEGALPVASLDTRAAEPRPALDAVGSARALQPLTQRVEWLTQRGGGSARVRLDPPHLGEVELQVRSVGSEIRISMIAEDAGARVLLEGGREWLVEHFASRDLRVSQFEIHDRSAAQHHADTAASRDSGTHHHSSEEGRTRRDAPADTPSLQSRDTARATTTPRAGQRVDLRI